ncbi:MAG: hypothetical protein GY769_07760 [bacterium]|nr:hypothetical protein [bacterium]
MESTNRVAGSRGWVARRLRPGLQWLWSNRRHRRGALISHHGITARAGECGLWIAASGADALPVVGLQLNSKYDLETDTHTGCITVAEAEDFEKIVGRLAGEIGGTTIKSTWNGVGTSSLSVQLFRMCSKAVAALVDEEQKGCPKPDHRMHCSWDGCSWYSDGHKKTRLPRGWR